MKPINKDELYAHLSGFLKEKGIEMKEGSYSQIVQKGCSIMADAVNLTQQGMERAKTEIDKRLDQMRQVIHEKTAPKPAPSSPPPPSPASASASTNSNATATKPARKSRQVKKTKSARGKPRSKRKS